MLGGCETPLESAQGSLESAHRVDMSLFQDTLSFLNLCDFFLPPLILITNRMKREKSCVIYTRFLQNVRFWGIRKSKWHHIYSDLATFDGKSIFTCRPGGGVYSVDTLLTHTVFDCFAFFSIEAERAPIFFSIGIEIIKTKI